MSPAAPRRSPRIVAPLLSRPGLALALLLVAWLPLRAAAAADFVYRPVGISLYQDPATVRARIPGGPSALGGYVHGLSHVLREALTPAGTPGFAGAAVLILRPGQTPCAWLVQPGTLPDAVQARIESGLRGVAVPRLDGALALALRFEAWGGDGRRADPAAARPLPAAWQARLGATAGAPLDDAALDSLCTPR